MFPLALFKLFFTVEMVNKLCEYTNNYARLKGPEKPTLYRGWVDVTPDDLYMYFALLMYMTIIKCPNIDLFWSTKPFFS